MMKNCSTMFSSKSDEWETPKWLFDALHIEFGFDLDVCATKDNAKCSRYFTKAQDGLSQTWAGTCWMNPPYGRQIGKWAEKAYQSGRGGATVVCLLPARTDTKWWQEWCMRGEIFFLKGRLKFGGAKQGAPFPSAIVVFRPTVTAALANSRLALWTDEGTADSTPRKPKGE